MTGAKEMKKHIPIIVAIVMMPSVVFAGLVQETDLTYMGAFRVPQGEYGGTGDDYSFSYGGYGLEYNSTNGTLYSSGKLGKNYAEFYVVTPIISSDIDSLNISTMRQNFYDITEGNRNNIAEGGVEYLGNGNIGGDLFLYGGELYGTVWSYYDGPLLQYLGFYKSGLDFSEAGDFDGMYRVGDETYHIGIKANYMCDIPSEWQASFGGAPALTGRCFDPVLGRTSFGPSVSTFYPDSVGVVEPSPSTVLTYYQSNGDNATLGIYVSNGPGNPNVTPADVVGGIVFAEGTDSVLFIGMHGTGDNCYKCAIPNNPAGNGAYPYVYFIWAYDANDLAASYQGDYEVTQNDYDTSRFWDGVYPNQTALAVGDTVRPWNVVPYDKWELDVPLFPDYTQINIPHVRGACYDPIESKIYIAGYGADGGSDKPLIHVYSLDTGTSTPAEVDSPASLTVGRTQ